MQHPHPPHISRLSDQVPKRKPGPITTVARTYQGQITTRNSAAGTTHFTAVQWTSQTATVAPNRASNRVPAATLLDRPSMISTNQQGLAAARREIDNLCFRSAEYAEGHSTTNTGYPLLLQHTNWPLWAIIAKPLLPSNLRGFICCCECGSLASRESSGSLNRGMYSLIRVRGVLFAWSILY